MKKNNLLVLILSMMLVLSITITACAIAFADEKKLTKEEINSIVDTSTDKSLVTSPFTQVSNMVRNSVVGVNNYQTVTTYSIGGSNGWGFDFGFGFPFGDDYGRGGQQQSKEQLAGTGSGVVITDYGHVLTNYHVVEKASRITVTVEGDDKEYEATVAGFDADLDVAVLYVPGINEAPAKLGDSDQLQVGEWAIVIGNPLGERFARTLTVGVVSALDRKVTDTTYDIYGRKTSVTNQMIQTDAAINNGNSGGGMFNVLGQLMGIPARKYTSNSSVSADVDNIGMCIPINTAKPLIREVLENFDPASEAATKAAEEANGTDLTGKPRLGITILTLRNTSGSSLPNGAYVKEVEANSPAARAGMQDGDIIVAVNDTVIANQSELTSALSNYNAGDTLKIKVYRLNGITDIVDLDNWTVDLNTLETMKGGNYIDLTATLEIIDKAQSSKN